MKVSAAIFAVVFTGLANAQSQCLSSAEAIPSCGQSCLVSAASSYGCASTDFACQCSHSSQINNGPLTTCVLSACSSNIQSALAVSSGAVALCSCVATAAPAGNSATATSAGSIPSTTNAISVSGTQGATTAAAGSGSHTAAVSMQTSGGAGATSSVPMFTGGAATAAGSIGGVVAGLMGLVAYL